MPFVLFLFLGIILLFICSSDNAKAFAKVREYDRVHLPHKYQEEFLLACELYLQYQLDPERTPEKKTAREAKKDACLKIKEEGFLPSCYNSADMWKSWEESSWMLYQDTIIPYSWYGIEHIWYHDFKKCQLDDRGITGISYNNPLLKADEDWGRYCYQMDKRFNELVDRYREFFDIFYLGPKIDQDDPGYPFKYYKD